MLRGNFNNTGGQQVNWDDFYILQNEAFKSIELQYQGSGAFILQGCSVTGSGPYAISAGLVFIDGKVLQFSSLTGVTSFPKYIHQATPVNQDSFTLEQGGSAYKRTLYKSELVSSVPGSGEYITMSASGGRNYNDVLSNQFVRLSGSQTVSGTKTFSSTIVGNITGNAGTVTNGVLTTGNQTINGIKSFVQTISGSTTGNAGTVTNGVYTNTTQSITGQKYFSSPVIATGGCQTGNVVLKTKVLSIGAWNMQSTLSVDVTHGLSDIDKIVSIDVIVRNDGGNTRYPFFAKWSPTDGIQSGTISFINATVVRLLRDDATDVFNQSVFSSTAFSRGKVYITYEA